ncbi:ABC transporter ATP-binding protein [Spirochaeta lutea]|uniref:ABC transporter n=1 Tax=Spirochaeta lutea TaxID=1480694 RepID=A0A098QU34_9SPIO|nr:ABC transporter ATP-binding protein [Spirochaeta lutea]KGE71244.1 ABC transporter [Spirochaeta lutea]
MITVRNLTKEYHSGETVVKALRGVDLDIGAGEFLSIAGPSGSGKSTLLNLMGCIDTPDSGTLKVEDQDVSRLNKDQLALFRRRRLGFIFQTYNLIPVLTGFENVALALNLLGLPDSEIRDRTRAILDEVGLLGMEDRVPSKLSGGQQQRVAIARALVKEPSIVLADEPTANLDSKTGEDILKLMEDMNKRHGTTFVFSTHDPMVMQYAHRLIQLHDGLIQSDERRAEAETARVH